MIVFLVLLSLLVSTGILDSKKKKKQRIEKVLKRRTNQAQPKQKTKSEPHRYSKNGTPLYGCWGKPNPNFVPRQMVGRITLKEVIEIFGSLDAKEKKYVQRLIQEKVVHGNYKNKQAFEEFLEYYRKAIERKSRHQGLSENQKKLLALAEDLFVPDNDSSSYRPLHSSWLISVKYTPRTKMMWVNMIRGKAIYKFPNVPKEAYLALLAQVNHAGTYWWKNWYWKYSTNAAKWNKYKKRRRK